MLYLVGTVRSCGLNKKERKRKARMSNFELGTKYDEKLLMMENKLEGQKANLKIVLTSLEKTETEVYRLKKAVETVYALKSEMDSLRGFLGAEDSMARYQKLNYMRDSERTEEESVELAEIKRERSRARADISDIESRLRKAELGWKVF